MITLKEIIERDKRPPSVTVSMICYNHAKYLDEAIRGVLMQKTNFPVNIVIHDDASPDGSAEIIRRYASENPNITAIIEETNYYQNGKSFFPKVLPHLTGKYIAYCECDDFWIDENKLQIQVDYLEANPDCSAVCSNTLPVNKYSQYDESLRMGHQKKTGEGDYPTWYRGMVKHQTASYMIRNFWQFMTHDDIDFYISTRDFGDEKLLNICFELGRVHYFKKELSAYRIVFDEGYSVNAIRQRMDKYDVFKQGALYRSELYIMLEHFFGKKYYRKYIYVLWKEFCGRIKFRRSVIMDANFNKCYHFRNIPWFIWPAFAVYIAYKTVRKAAKETLKLLLPQSIYTRLKSIYFKLSDMLTGI